MKKYVWRLYYTTPGGAWEYDDFESREDRADHLSDYLDDYDAFVLRDGFQDRLPDEPEILEVR